MLEWNRNCVSLFGGADILVCPETASAGFGPPSRLELAREKSTSPLANPTADKNVCPTSGLLRLLILMVDTDVCLTDPDNEVNKCGHSRTR